MTTERALNNGEMQNPDFILSKNPEKAIQEMMETIDRLRSVYTEETDALLQTDTMKFLQIQDRKISAACNYQAGVAQIVSRKDEMKKTNPGLHDALQKKQEEFAIVAVKNIDALTRMRRTVQRLGEHLSVAARAAIEKKSVNYGATGSINRPKHTVSIGINESA
ncbi:MAG: flagellar protein FlgN [Proteobacteria bacterium]|nr:flagellar protein FlgN [Pseudomonadota bacterium]